MNKLFLVEDLYNNNVYYLQGVSNVSGTKRSTVTQYTTPSGTKISDNAFVEPKSLTFSILTSHIATNTQKILKSGDKELQPLTIQDIKDVINEWQDNAIRLNITTFEGYYPNMILSQTQTTEGDNLGVWQPTLTFTEVRQADVQYIKLDFPQDAQEKADGTSEQDLGADNGTSVGKVIGGAGAGALAGAAIGSFFPGPGTAIGAGIGAVVGFFTSIF